MMLIFFPPESYGFFFVSVCAFQIALWNMATDKKTILLHSCRNCCCSNCIRVRFTFQLSLGLYLCLQCSGEQAIVHHHLYLSVSRLSTIFCLFAEFIGHFILKQIKRCVERDETGTIEKCYRNNKKVVQKVGRCKNYEIIIRNESSYPYTLFRFICFSLGVYFVRGFVQNFCLVFVCVFQSHMRQKLFKKPFKQHLALSIAKSYLCSEIVVSHTQK